MINLLQAHPPGHEVLLLAENWALESEGATATFNWAATGGNLGTVSHVLNPYLDLVLRSGSISTLVNKGILRLILRVNFPRPRAIDCVSGHRTNSVLPWRFRLYQSASGSENGDTPVYDSSWIDPVVRARPSDYETFTSMDWLLGPGPSDLETRASNRDIDFFGAADRAYYNIRQLLITWDISEGSNGAFDYLELAMLMAGRSFRPRINMLTGWDLSVNDRSETRRMDSGALLGRQKSQGLVFNFTIGYSKREEAFGRVLRGIARRGPLSRVFVWPEPAQPQYFHDTAFVGTMTTLPRVKMANLEYPAAEGFTIEETQ